MHHSRKEKEGFGVGTTNALSLARFARARRVHRERRDMLSAEIRGTIILPTLSAPDGARENLLKKGITRVINEVHSPPQGAENLP